MGFFKAKAALVELRRTVKIEYADHGVNELRHGGTS
jgi:hypothetical protein